MFYFNGLILTADFLSKTLHVQICFPIRSYFIRRDIIVPVSIALKKSLER